MSYGNLMADRYENWSPDIDPSDTWDTQRFDLVEVAPVDWTLDLPPIEGTTDRHPTVCSCSPCVADAEAAAWADTLAEIESDRAFAEALERRAENGTWWGR